MKKLALLALLSACGNSHSVNTFVAKDVPDHRIKVMVIDTGYDLKNPSVPLCNGGHRSYVDSTLMDFHGHGTHISDLIDQHVKGHIRSNYWPLDFKNTWANLGSRPEHSQYCQVICKYYDPNGSGKDNLNNLIKCVRQAISYKVQFINIAGGGSEFAFEERKAFITALNKGIVVVAAAGNEHNNLDIAPYYPASYDHRIIVVGSKKDNGYREYYSNFGARVDAWEIGTSVVSALPSGGFGMMSGTSQACAIHTGKLIRAKLKEPLPTVVSK